MPFDYNDNYHRELDRRNELKAAVSTPVVVLALLGSLLGYMFQNYQLALDLAGVIFGILALWSIGAIGITAFFLARAIHGHTYKRLEGAIILREYHQALREWHEKHGQGVPAADKEFDDYLERSYAISGDHNARLNDKRSADIFRAHRMMIYAAVLTGVTFLPFAYAILYQNQNLASETKVDVNQTIYNQGDT
ncbi:hypothetical protein [Marinobacter sp. LN3S78]|uniref:hypothetical protein n=1 Tax=Marinobacter sp. LN3S78 TaxID=3382300 RepID=UPI00387B0D15